MKAPVVIKKDAIKLEPKANSGKEGDAGWWARVIAPSHVDTKGLTMGISHTNPGFPAHGWHTHTIDKKENKGLGIEVEVKYPKKDGEYLFEEFYYILSGSGIIQWEAEDGRIREIKVSAGDIVFFPRDVARHQLFNNGKEIITTIWGGSPLTERIIKPLGK